MSRTLIVATHNAHKTGEIAAMLAGCFGEVVDLTAFPDLEPPEESGATFEANARIKALAASEAMPDAFVLADDSGIEVDALGGAPGVFSARYAGEAATDAANREKLLADLAAAGARGKARTARFRCVLVVARDREVIALFDGAVEGVVANEARGDGGFGYDPVFIPEGYCETFGQLPPATKHALSHRGRALEKLKAWLEKSGDPA
ncbi:MAG: RdgB/HAM1 family non-canonical purine NTP pyrophosphatase [Akkermansiaceae bacterium]|nr:RdgB/HAM1 family non-canonical purine NTP pyrophosphatase [Akkermansiaceae bacterium]